jgi:hypothetical protein
MALDPTSVLFRLLVASRLTTGRVTDARTGELLGSVTRSSGFIISCRDASGKLLGILRLSGKNTVAIIDGSGRIISKMTIQPR